MSSLFIGKYKFFYPNGNFDFSIYVKQATEFDFSSGSVNSIRQFEFYKNDNNNRNMYFTFAIFKVNSPNEFNDYLNEQEKKILFFVLQNENQEVSKKKNNRIPNLIFSNEK